MAIDSSERGASPRGDGHETAQRSGIGRGVVLFLGVLVLGAAVLLVYYPAARGPFVFDDAGTIVDNPSIRQLWPLVGDEESPGSLNAPRTTAVHGRPLVNLSLALNYHFGELDPFGYRIVNMVVHFLSAVLLWVIVARTLRLDFFRGRFERVADLLSFAAALVWALHPVNTESVVYVTQRTELMRGLFYLATLYASMRYWNADRRATRTAWLLVASAACLSGMLCKEMMASAPAMVLLYERTFVAGTFRRALKRSWPLYVGLALAWLPVVALNLSGPRTPASGFGLGVAAHEWWFTQAKLLYFYLKLAVWPWPLVIHYEVPYLTSVAEAWPWLLLTGLLGIGTVMLVWRHSCVGFAATWFFAVLSPTLLIPLVNEIAAERRMYVPLTAIVALLIVGGYVGLQYAWRLAGQRAKPESVRRGPLAAFVVATIAVAITFGSVSSRRLAAFGDELTLWQDAVVYQPHDPMVQFNLGTLLAEAGHLPRAIVHLEEAVRLDPDLSQAHYNLAHAFEESMRPQDAVDHYREAARLQPDNGAAHYNLARLLERGGQTQEATERYRQAVVAQPDFPAAHTNLGVLLLTAGQTQEAIESFETALGQQEDAGNLINLAMAYSQASRTAEAIALAERSLELARSQRETALAERIEGALAYLRSQRPLP